jgi:hypothetical protein
MLVLSFFGLNEFISLGLSLIICSPILFADYIIRNIIENKKKGKRIEEGRLKQEIVDSSEINGNKIIFCPKCGKKNLIETTHCNFCGKDLRVIT